MKINVNLLSDVMNQSEYQRLVLLDRLLHESLDSSINVSYLQEMVSIIRKAKITSTDKRSALFDEAVTEPIGGKLVPIDFLNADEWDRIRSLKQQINESLDKEDIISRMREIKKVLSKAEIRNDVHNGLHLVPNEVRHAIENENVLPIHFVTEDEWRQIEVLRSKFDDGDEGDIFELHNQTMGILDLAEARYEIYQEQKTR
ncbi:hypothetical protein ABHN11_13340 [Brevibacillus centrosporus]|jgi:hypothetical protein|uniref:hypothetical protein n=1 Tax=Brevibacillus centrosporus TaxID=54910 RepID=UPI00398581EF